MPLHRFVTPTYFGGLPATHDLINVVSGGLGAGDGSAPVDAPRSAPHPNAGTYFVAFGEDATSGHANRGFKALSENTDFLDDIVHTDQSVPVVSAAVVPGAPVGSVVVSANVFVGGATEINDQRTRSGLVAVLDGDGYPLHILSGTVYVPVTVSKIHDGTGTSVVGTSYFVNPTVDFTPSIPSGQSYRLVYYTRSNFKSQPARTYTRLANGVRGEEDLWAFAKTTRLGNVTFTGVKDFQGFVNFSNSVQFDDPVNVIDTLNTNSFISMTGNPRILVGSLTLTTAQPFIDFQNETGPYQTFLPLTKWQTDLTGRYIRDYYDNGLEIGSRLVVRNAFWDESLLEWQPDNLADRASIGIIGSKLIHANLLPDSGTNLLPSDWIAQQWLTGTIGPGSATIIEGAITVREYFDFADPAYVFASATTGLVSAYDALVVNNIKLNLAMGQWVPLTTFYTQSAPTIARVPRLYAANTTFEGLRLSWNAHWDMSISQWVADSQAVSGRQAYVVDISAAGLTARSKSDTSASWLNNAYNDILHVNESTHGVPPVDMTYMGGTLAVSKSIGINKGQPAINVGVSDWRSFGSGWNSVVAGGFVWFPLDISPGTSLTIFVDVFVDPAQARSGSNRITVDLMKRTPTFLGIVGFTPLNTAFDDTTTSPQVITVTATVTVTAEDELAVRVTSGNPLGSSDNLYHVRLRYNASKHTPNFSG